MHQLINPYFNFVWFKYKTLKLKKTYKYKRNLTSKPEHMFNILESTLLKFK